MKLIKNIIGSLIRDIILLFSGEYSYFTIVDSCYIYKSWIPFKIKVGDYLFIPKKEYDLIIKKS